MSVFIWRPKNILCELLVVTRLKFDQKFVLKKNKAHEKASQLQKVLKKGTLSERNAFRKTATNAAASRKLLGTWTPLYFNLTGWVCLKQGVVKNSSKQDKKTCSSFGNICLDISLTAVLCFTFHGTRIVIQLNKLWLSSAALLFLY